MVEILSRFLLELGRFFFWGKVAVSFRGLQTSLQGSDEDAAAKMEVAKGFFWHLDFSTYLAAHRSRVFSGEPTRIRWEMVGWAPKPGSMCS